MCGICGKLNFTDQPVDEKILKKMCVSLSCRGPDDGDVYLCTNPEVRDQKIHAGLGHQRLSIIDLSAAGHQPMCNEDRTVWLAYNGEIYNFMEIKKELETKGHRFKSHTDTEVIIHLYEEEGVDCMKRFNGMFSFALWDERLKRLFLCRDRIGIKPLVYYWDGQSLIFASEIKAVLLDPRIKKEIDFEALNLYLTFNYIPAPKTIFKNLFKLEPGHYLLAENQKIITKQYWNIVPEPVPLKETIKNDSRRIDLYKKTLYELMERSVKKRLIADVPLGAFLSGGVDSSILVGLMARNSTLPVKTFSIGYKDLPFFDETRYSREVASFNKTEHYEFKLSHTDILEAFPEVLETIDEPFADSSVVPTYIVSRETREHVTVALAGDGADELFAGYRMYQGEYFAGYYNALPSFLKKKLIEPLINSLPDSRDRKYSEYLRRLKKFVTGMSGSFLERFYSWQEIFPEDIRKKLIRPIYADSFSLHSGREFIEKITNECKSDNINRMLYADLKSSLPGDMLNKVDWMSMKNSLEVRVPFLDHEVVESVFKMEGDVKLKRLKRKYILLETFKDILPKMIHNRPKQGFEMPIGAWLRNELKFLIDDYLSRDFIEKQGIFTYDAIHNLVTSHLSKKTDTSWQMWNLIVFGHWFKKYYL